MLLNHRALFTCKINQHRIHHEETRRESAVVTGASKGIGASIAKHLAAEGAAVVVNYASNQKAADRVVDEITSAGGKAIAIQADVSKKAEVEHLFAKTQHVFGLVDILVNNAGIYEYLPLENITEKHFH
jgi:3-oxoacyl-[acyl-carrier protein] reductase